MPADEYHNGLAEDGCPASSAVGDVIHSPSQYEVSVSLEHWDCLSVGMEGHGLSANGDPTVKSLPFGSPGIRLVARIRVQSAGWCAEWSLGRVERSAGGLRASPFRPTAACVSPLHGLGRPLFLGRVCSRAVAHEVLRLLGGTVKNLSAPLSGCVAFVSFGVVAPP